MILKQLKRYKWTVGFALMFLGWILFGPSLLEQVLNSAPVQDDIIAGVPDDANLSGRLLYTQDLNGILQFDLETETSSVFWEPEDDGIVNGLALSPDGTQLIVAYAPPVSGGLIGNADLYLMDIATQELTPFLMRENTAESYRNPYWSPDGEWVYFTHYMPIVNDNGATVGITLNVERVSSTGDGRIQLMAQGAEQPALSPDGTQLAYLGYDTSTYQASVWIAGASGDDPFEVIPAGTFAILGSPRFSPDGGQICFSASGGIQTPTDVFSPNIAYAHGAPWEIWCVNLDGNELQQMTQGIFDDVVFTFEPDGDNIAFIESKTLFLLVDEQIYALDEVTIRGEVVWLSD